MGRLVDGKEGTLVVYAMTIDALFRVGGCESKVSDRKHDVRGDMATNGRAFLCVLIGNPAFREWAMLPR
jgi:hypothetical protein